MRMTFFAVALLAAAPAVAGPKWDATLQACGDAYDLYYKPNLGNPGANAVTQYQLAGVPGIASYCATLARDYAKRIEIPPAIATTLFTEANYRSYVENLDRTVCIMNTAAIVDPASYHDLTRQKAVDGCAKNFTAAQRKE